MGTTEDRNRRVAKHLKTVNLLLRNASPVGAYCLGMGSAVGDWDSGIFPPKCVLVALANCMTLESGQAILSRLAKPTPRKREQKQ